MSVTKAAVVALTFTIAAIGLGSVEAHAQGTFADKAVTRLVGKWVSTKGRTISFVVRDGNPIFQDELEPNVTLTGAYRQDDTGAGYVLRYTQGFDCRYNLSVVGSEGDEINLRLVSSFIPEGARFRCVEGTLKRTTQY
jgi:hypothetical protein